jgi:predicted metal-binding protein
MTRLPPGERTGSQAPRTRDAHVARGHAVIRSEVRDIAENAASIAYPHAPCSSYDLTNRGEYMKFDKKKYIAVVQCHIVMERCAGFLCEKSFHDRSGGFKGLEKSNEYRVVYLTCGGCCGRAVQRKLYDLICTSQEYDKITKEEILVKFSSCITKESYHGPKCPHLDYLVDLIKKLKVDVSLDTHISDLSEERRKKGVYKS